MMLFWVLVACTGGSSDTGATEDGDTGTDGTAPVESPLGAIQGQCGVLDEGEWASDDPFLFRNSIDMVGWDETWLSDQGRQVWDAGNLGGSSLESEVLAFEALHTCEQAQLLKTEGEITYDDAGGKKTDLLVSIDGRDVGVSVTRAYHYPPEDPFTAAEASELLASKLTDAIASAENATDSDAWERTMLHVIAYDSQYADEVELAWANLEALTRNDIIVLVTVTDGNDEAIY